MDTTRSELTSHDAALLVTSACEDGEISRMFRTARGLPSVQPPSWEVLPSSILYDDDRLPRPEVMAEHFRREGLLSETDAIDIIMRCAMLLKSEPNVMRLDGKNTIVSGDIHGQFFDLLTLLEIGGSPSRQQYLFLGDYVDRGCFGMEVVLLLMAYKLRYPHQLVMLRGNHECRHLTAYFNFKREAEYKYTPAVYNAVVSAFDCLPLACVVGERFFCVHGGLSPELQTISDVNAVHRFREPPSSGPMCDLLWSDPLDEREGYLAGDTQEANFIPNTTRGCSYVYNHNAAVSFLEKNNMLTLIRGHEAQAEGFRLYRNGPKGFPSVICLFSAPNYCDTYDNCAAVLIISEGVLRLRQFNSSPHPYYLPNFMNAFMWSLNFAVDKLMEMWTGFIHLVDMETDEQTNPNGHPDVQACRLSIKEKMMQLNSLDDSLVEERDSSGEF